MPYSIEAHRCISCTHGLWPSKFSNDLFPLWYSDFKPHFIITSFYYYLSWYLILLTSFYYYLSWYLILLTSFYYYLSWYLILLTSFYYYLSWYNKIENIILYSANEAFSITVGKDAFKMAVFSTVEHYALYTFIGIYIKCIVTLVVFTQVHNYIGPLVFKKLY